MLLTCEPSTKSSLTPRIVTVCGRFQLLLVKVSVAGVTVTSPVSLLVRFSTTFDVG